MAEKRAKDANGHGEEDARTSGVISRLVAVFQSSVRSRPAKPQMVAKVREFKDFATRDKGLLEKLAILE